RVHGKDDVAPPGRIGVNNPRAGRDVGFVGETGGRPRAGLDCDVVAEGGELRNRLRGRGHPRLRWGLGSNSDVHVLVSLGAPVHGLHATAVPTISPGQGGVIAITSWRGSFPGVGNAPNARDLLIGCFYR